MTVYTLGHSTRSAEELLALLARYDIRDLADVRRYPASRRHPHFARDALAAAVAEQGVAYHWLPALGGRRAPRPDSPHVAWREPSFRAYADHMESVEFHDGLEALLALAAARTTAVLCAEAVPWRCHRQLIADALVARGVRVLHVTGPGAPSPHALSRLVRIDGDRLVYDVGHLPLPVGSRSKGPVP